MTQKANVLNHLKVFGSITPLEALNRYGCFRLGAIIFELRKEGNDITTEINDGNKKFAIYKMEV